MWAACFAGSFLLWCFAIAKDSKNTLVAINTVFNFSNVSTSIASMAYSSLRTSATDLAFPTSWSNRSLLSWMLDVLGLAAALAVAFPSLLPEFSL